jgi:3-oxoacyl-[acyl-carrier-protein] synthase-1
MVSILKYEINCATTLSKRVLEDGTVIPYFSLEKEIKQNQTDIYKAIKEVVVKVLPKDKKNTALLVGTSLVDWYLVDAINALAYEEKEPYKSKKRSIDSYAKDLSDELGLSGFTQTINTACTSSANALLEAKNLIEAGVVENVIVVGLEVFSPVMSSGFYSMDLLSPTKPKPFAKDRDGLVLGEGVGAILLGSEESSWEILGGFSNCNSETITSVSSSGEECVEVMQNALKNCSLQINDITTLKAHATGSLANDEAEMNAIEKVFTKKPNIITLKQHIGHTIGASGVLEIGYLMKSANSGTYMCNYFGFGGNNTSVIVRKKA